MVFKLADEFCIIIIVSVVVIILTGSDDLSAKLWDVCTGQCIYGIQTHTCAAVKFDEQKLVTGSFDNTIACWEWSTGAKIQQFRGHTGAGRTANKVRRAAMPDSCCRAV